MSGNKKKKKKHQRSLPENQNTHAMSIYRKHGKQTKATAANSNLDSLPANALIL